MDDVRNVYTEDLLTHLKSGQTVPANRQFSLGKNKNGAGWGMKWMKARADDDRGLVCLVDEIFWLGWSGHRSQNYESFNARRQADHHTRHFEPEPEDLDRLKLEDAWYAVVEEDRAMRAWALDGILDSHDKGGESRAEGPEAVGVLTATTSRADPSVADIRVDVRLASSQHLARAFAAVAGAVPGIDATDWEYSFDADSKGFGLYAMAEPDFLDRLSAVRIAHGTDALVSDPSLVADPRDGRAHVVSRTDQARGYVDGALIRGLCGHRFVPEEPADGRETCNVCAVIVAALGAGAD